MKTTKAQDKWFIYADDECIAVLNANDKENGWFFLSMPNYQEGAFGKAESHKWSLEECQATTRCCPITETIAKRLIRNSK